MRARVFMPRLVISFLLSLIPVQDFDYWIYSWRVRIQTQLQPHPPDPEILLLEWDEAAFQGGSQDPIRKLFHWNPRSFETLLERALRERPKALAVTWVIPDEAVRALPHQSPPSPALPALIRETRILFAAHPQSESNALNGPSSLAPRTQQGSIDFRVDSDGQVRRTAPRSPGTPTLAELLAQKTTSSSPDSRSASPSAPEEEGEAWIRYSSPSSRFAKIQVSDWLEGRIPGPLLKDRIVLLTRPADDSSNPKLRTPLGPMTRAEILAFEVQGLRQERELKVARPWLRILLQLLLLVGVSWGILSLPILASAIAIPSFGLLIVGAIYQILFQSFDFLIPAGNAVLGILITYLVFTGYKQAFQENLQWRALKQSQYLRELEQMKSNFLSLVSHDLKTPIARIQVLVETLRRALPGGTRGEASFKEPLDSIESANQELRHHIDSILNLSRIESSRVILNRRPNDLSRVIRQTLRRLGPIAAARQISIEERVEPLFSFEFDEELIRQVLTNLLDNAIKCSPPGGKVILRGTEQNGFVVVEVEDFGPGIPKDQLPLMFRKFSRIVRPLGQGDPVRGAGLGLYLTRYFIELHGGSIRVQSVEGQGTTFTFQLPLEGAEIETLLS
jgi:two-component system phosphate regulon sensor histidine kinase PhoR